MGWTKGTETTLGSSLSELLKGYQQIVDTSPVGSFAHKAALKEIEKLQAKAETTSVVSTPKKDPKAKALDMIQTWQAQGAKGVLIANLTTGQAAFGPDAEFYVEGETVSFETPEAAMAAFGLVEFVNLTPHALNVHDDAGNVTTLPASGQVARVATSKSPMPSVGGFSVTRSNFGVVEGLPDPKDGVFYVVSGMVLSALAGSRPDVLAPGELVRDEKGQPVGCKGFSA